MKILSSYQTILEIYEYLTKHNLNVIILKHLHNKKMKIHENEVEKC